MRGRICKGGGDEQGRENGAGLLGFDGDVKDRGELLVSDRSVGRKDLRDMHRVDIIDRHFRRHVRMDRAEGKSGGVNDHFAVEGGVERITGTEGDDYVMTGFSC